jgi:hypothetical protein
MHLNLDSGEPPRGRAVPRKTPRRIGARKAAILIIAAVVAIAAGTYFVGARGSSLIIPAGTTHVIRGESASSEQVQMNSAGTISGAYSSNSSLDFYVMTGAQYGAYQSGEFGAVVLAGGSELRIPPRGHSSEALSVPREGSLSGEFLASNPVSFYLMTSAQFSTYNLTGNARDYVYVGSGTVINVLANVQAGSYYTVFQAGTASSTTVDVTRPIQVAYAIPTSAYVFASSSPGAFSVGVGQGIYDLVWINHEAGNATLVVTQNIIAR